MLETSLPANSVGTNLTPATVATINHLLLKSAIESYTKASSSSLDETPMKELLTVSVLMNLLQNNIGHYEMTSEMASLAHISTTSFTTPFVSINLIGKHIPTTNIINHVSAASMNEVSELSEPATPHTSFD